MLGSMSLPLATRYTWRTCSSRKSTSNWRELPLETDCVTQSMWVYYWTDPRSSDSPYPISKHKAVFFFWKMVILILGYYSYSPIPRLSQSGSGTTLNLNSSRGLLMYIPYSKLCDNHDKSCDISCDIWSPAMFPLDVPGTGRHGVSVWFGRWKSGQPHPKRDWHNGPVYTAEAVLWSFWGEPKYLVMTSAWRPSL